LLAKLCKQRQTISVMPNKDKLEKKHVANWQIGHIQQPT
jgi:hypothetical protein